MKFAPEGYPFIAVSAAVSAVCFWAGGAVAAAVPVLTTFFMFYFFRDPERVVPHEQGLFVSPADGKVIVVRETDETEYLHARVMQISIFMSPMDVHVNRVPCDGKVKSVKHAKGMFLAAYKDEASVRNEHIDMVLETRYGDVLVRQVAGFVARRAVCRVTEGDVLQRGERYGIIKFSSRVDIYVPRDASVKVRTGDMVRAGETVLCKVGERGSS
jgi:phosphatidylserine decarboxylase